MSLVTLAYMIGMSQQVFRRSAPPALQVEQISEVPVTMRAAMLMLAVAMLLVGLLPQLLDPLLNLAART
jgi:formate hydrogenlyase subunit 3/multisubunit Na+/H+ antiporter MnhD subunit